MTTSSWNNLSYYGKRVKTDFKILHKMIKTHADQPLDDQKIDTLLKMMKHKTTIAMTVTKIVDLMDTTKRIENIEKLLEAVSSEALIEAQQRIGKQ